MSLSERLIWRPVVFLTLSNIWGGFVLIGELCVSYDAYKWLRATNKEGAVATPTARIRKCQKFPKERWWTKQEKNIFWILSQVRSWFLGWHMYGTFKDFYDLTALDLKIVIPKLISENLSKSKSHVDVFLIFYVIPWQICRIMSKYVRKCCMVAKTTI